jgi:hypothetical protein
VLNGPDRPVAVVVADFAENKSDAVLEFAAWPIDAPVTHR